MYGFRFQEAKIYKSWVRFEASVKHNYAHQITEQLLEKDDNSNYIIQKEMELQGLIAKRIVDRYCFYDMALDEAVTFSEDLAEIASGAQVGTLSRPNARDNPLHQFITYLKTNSGLFSTFTKVYAIWGDAGERKLLEHLKKHYEKFKWEESDKKSDIQIVI